MSEKYAEIRILKDMLRQEVATNKLYIFVWEDNPFLAFQYANVVAKVRELPIEYVNSFEALCSSDDNLFSLETTSDALKVLKIDKFECPQGFDLTKITDAIIICKDINIESDLIYRFPKLEDWQIIDFMISQCHGLTKEEVKWLYDITSSISKNKENVYRLDNEMKKIKCFPVEDQESIFKALSSSNGYGDLSPLTIFNFTNAILKKDKITVMNVLEDIDSIDVEGVGLVTILHKNFKQLIDVQMGKNVTAESLGMSPKQFNAVKYNCGKYQSQDLIRIFKFLTSLDYKLKSGLLELSNSRMIDYIVCSVMS